MSKLFKSSYSVLSALAVAIITGISAPCTLAAENNSPKDKQDCRNTSNQEVYDLHRGDVAEDPYFRSKGHVQFPEFKDVKVRQVKACSFLIDAYAVGIDEKGAPVKITYFAYKNKKGGEWQNANIFPKDMFVTRNEFLRNLQKQAPDVIKKLGWENKFLDSADVEEMNQKPLEYEEKGVYIVVNEAPEAGFVYNTMLGFDNYEAHYDPKAEAAKANETMEIAFQLMNAMTPGGLTEAQKKLFWDGYKRTLAKAKRRELFVDRGETVDLGPYRYYNLEMANTDGYSFDFFGLP